MAQLKGTTADDLIKGTRVDDSIRGLAGDDTLFGRDGDDTLDGGKGNDVLLGANGKDTLSGGAGDDVLKGGSHANDSFSFDARDTLDGGAGRDRLIGGYGSDQMTGGSGRDKFIYQALDDSEFSDPDTITDFTQGEDKLVFQREFATANLHFIGTDEFSGVSGEVRYVADEQAAAIVIDLDGDSQADLRIQFSTPVHFQASDFSF